MRINLEHSGKPLFEIESGQIKDELVIGRSKECGWVTPPDDSSVGRRHVSLSRHGKHVVVRDLGSKNGTFHKGRKVRKVRVGPGEKVTFGSCVLLFSEGAESAAARPAEVIVRSGSARGKRKAVDQRIFTIGSDPAASLVLMDDLLVSRHHAQIESKEGGYWIKDLGSTNGTKVNANPLRPEQERLLQNGDRIDVAHVEIAFFDGSSTVGGRRVWLRLGVMVAAVVVAAGLYTAYQQVRPSAASFTSQAHNLAVEGKFPAARDALKKAEVARGHSQHGMRITELWREINLWESTIATWEQARANLGEGRWVEASRDLGTLSDRAGEAWGWGRGGEGADARKEALHTKRLLDTTLAASAAMRDSDLDEAALRQRLDDLEKAEAAIPQPVPEHLRRLQAEMTNSLGALKMQRGYGDRIEKALKSIEGGQPAEIDVTIAAIRQVESEARGKLRSRAELLLEPLTACKESAARLDEMRRLGCALQLEDAAKVQIGLPPSDACAVHPSVSLLRKNLDVAYLGTRQQIATLAVLLKDTVAYLDRCGQYFAEGQHWQSPEVMKAVIGCDSLRSAYPSRSRTDPVGQFDRYLGVETFYSRLPLGDKNQPEPWTSLSFRPVLADTQETAEMVQRAVAFLADPANAWLRRDKVARLCDTMQGILAARGRIVAAMLTQAESLSGREAIVAAGIAYVLAEDPAAATLAGTPLSKWIEAKVRALRAEVQKLDTEYEYAPPERQLIIRDQVMQKGIPGDSLLKKMWLRKSAVKPAP